MRVLITGATGQVARALLASVPKGCQAIALDRQQLDLADPKAIAAAVRDLRPDWVINAGAYTAVDSAEANEPQALAINAGAPRAIADALGESGGRLLQLSSDYVFDGTLPRPYRTEDRPNPLSVYGRSKLLGEAAAGPDALVVRSSWLYAATGRNFVHTMLERMTCHGEVRVVADQIGVPTWAASLAEALWQLIALEARGIHHFCDGGEASWHEFAEAIAEEACALGLLPAMPRVLPIATGDYPAAAHRPAYSVLDDSATRALLGSEPTHWRINLRRMLQELQRARQAA